MNLALRDLRRHVIRFVGTAAGLGLLLTVVIAMQGIYAGMVDDATILTRAMASDLWIVQRDTRGPFAEASRLDPSVEQRAASIPFVRRARPYTYQVIQRDYHGGNLRIALVGLGWPDDVGQTLPLVRGRRLSQPHGEMIVDRSLGLVIGDSLELAGEPYRVVGTTEHAVTAGGDSVAFMSVADTQLVAFDQPAEATVLERARVTDRLRQTDLGRSQPALAELATDPRWQRPALALPPLAAVLIDVEPHRVADVRRIVEQWGDVAVYSQDEQEALLLGGVVQRARLQIGLFTIILTMTATVIVMMVIYNLTLEKTHDLAILKLLGMQRRRLLGLVLQQAWLLGAVAYAVAYVIGNVAYPRFPRRVLITDEIAVAAPIITLLVATLASVVGVIHVMRVDSSSALEG
jgi:putative ABC transport system permease protein